MQPLINTHESLLIYVIAAILILLALTQLPTITATITEVVQRPVTTKIKPSL